jgi:CubicO group peptidase (beta-lactamase class C family)
MVPGIPSNTGLYIRIMSSGMAGKPQISRYFLFSIFFIFSIPFTSCHVARYVYWNFADIHDNEKFPARVIEKSAKPTSFHKSEKPFQPKLPEDDKVRNDTSDFTDFLANHKTVAFLIIRNDSLIYEHYFQGFSRASVLPSFSIAKSFVSALVGIAIAEGKISSVDQPVTDFIPEMTDTGFRKVTIRNLLEMRSGIKFKESYGSPFGEMPKFYYGLNLKKYTISLKTINDPGHEYNYQSANTQILAMVLERATGRSLAEYMEEKIWKPMGSAYPASWSFDSNKNRETKAFCCINATAEDFARFGQLYLNNGLVGSDTVVPSGWIRETLTIRNDSRDSQGFPYTCHWRVTAEGDFFAKGVLGQYIYICPAKKIVIVRFGQKSTDLVWARFFKHLITNL